MKQRHDTRVIPRMTWSLQETGALLVLVLLCSCSRSPVQRGDGGLIPDRAPSRDTTTDRAPPADLNEPPDMPSGPDTLVKTCAAGQTFCVASKLHRCAPDGARATLVKECAYTTGGFYPS